MQGVLTGISTILQKKGVWWILRNMSFFFMLYSVLVRGVWIYLYYIEGVGGGVGEEWGER